MGFWWIDRALPGIVASLIMATVMGVSHILLRRHVTRTADRQTAELRHEPPEGTS